MTYSYDRSNDLPEVVADLATRVSVLERQSGGVQYDENDVPQFPDGIDTGGTGDVSNPPAPVGPDPGDPANLVATVGALYDDIYVDLTWTAPGDPTNLSGYEITVERVDNPGPGETLVLEAFVQVGVVTEQRVRGLRPNTTYDATLYSLNPSGIRSTNPSTIRFTTGADNTTPGQVTGLVSTAGVRTIVSVWNEVGEADVDNGRGIYELQVDTVATFDSVDLRTSRVGGTIASIGDLFTNTLYYTRVRAIDASGNAGPWSTNDNTVTAAVDSDDVAAGAINTIQIADLAVDTAKIADLAVGTAKIADLAVTTAKINDLAVTSAKIEDATITTAKIGLLQVTDALIANAAITEAKIDDLAVTDAKISSLSAAKITAGTIDSEAIVLKGLFGIIKSDFYIAGTSGWQIDGNGGAEFNDVTVRGTVDASNITGTTMSGGTITGTTIRTSTSGQRIVIDSDAIDFYNSTGTLVGKMYVLSALPNYISVDTDFYAQDGLWTGGRVLANAGSSTNPTFSWQLDYAAGMWHDGGNTTTVQGGGVTPGAWIKATNNSISFGDGATTYGRYDGATDNRWEFEREVFIAAGHDLALGEGRIRVPSGDNTLHVEGARDLDLVAASVDGRLRLGTWTGLHLDGDSPGGLFVMNPAASAWRDVECDTLTQNSDARRKEGITPATDDILAQIKAGRGKAVARFRRKPDADHLREGITERPEEFGLIAQEVPAVARRVMNGGSDGELGINVSSMLAVHHRALEQIVGRLDAAGI